MATSTTHRKRRPAGGALRLLAGLSLLASAPITNADGRGGRPHERAQRRRRTRGGGRQRTENRREQKRADLRQLHEQALRSPSRPDAPPLQLRQEEPQQQQKPERRLQQLCSCAPRSFSITLDLLADCGDDTLSLQPGIADTDCTVEVGDPVAAIEGATPLSGTIEAILEELANATEDSGVSVEIVGGNGTDAQLNSHELGLTAGLPLLSKTSMAVQKMIEGIPWLEEEGEEAGGEEAGEEDAKEEGEAGEGGLNKKQQKKQKKQRLREGSQEEAAEAKVNKRKQRNGTGANGSGTTRRRLQSPNVPVEINSLTLIELSADGDVLNVDDRFTNVAFPTGTTFELESISRLLVPGVPLEDQFDDLVPVTTVLFYIGRNAAGFGGEEVRGRFVWQYTNGCGADDAAIEVGDELAWNVWTSVEDQSAEFCPANGDGPAPTPTQSPSFGVTDLTLEPTIEAAPTPPPVPTPGTASPTIVVTDLTLEPTFELAPSVPTVPPGTEEPTRGTGGMPTTAQPTRNGGMSMSMPSNGGRPSSDNLYELLDHFDSGSRSGRWHGKAGKTSKSRKAGKRSKGEEHWDFLSRSRSGKASSKSSKSSKSSSSSKSSKSSSSSSSSWSSSSGSSSKHSRSRLRR